MVGEIFLFAFLQEEDQYSDVCENRRMRLAAAATWLSILLSGIMLS